MSGGFGCGLWGIAARIHSKMYVCSHCGAVACGESPLGYTHHVECGLIIGLWLVGNRRSDTLSSATVRSPVWLWLVGNRRSDTLGSSYHVCSPRCGLWGIAARIHYLLSSQVARDGCGLWGIAARIHLPRFDKLKLIAVACGESPLGYTNSPSSTPRPPLWLVGNRRSDTLPRA